MTPLEELLNSVLTFWSLVSSAGFGQRCRYQSLWSILRRSSDHGLRRGALRDVDDPLFNLGRGHAGVIPNEVDLRDIVIELARQVFEGLPPGLELHAIQMADGRWAALNNRTLGVAQGANLPYVDVTDDGDSGMNQYNRNLKASGLQGPVENAKIRCDD